MRVARLTNLNNWEDIAGRGTAYLQRNVDYRCWHEELKAAARNAAASMGYRVKIYWHDQEQEILRLVFTRFAKIPETRIEFWDRVLDGEARRLTQNIDFDESVSAFRKRAHKAARGRGKRAIINASGLEIELYAVRIS